MIEQLIMNLSVNSRDAMPRRHLTIKISTLLTSGRQPPLPGRFACVTAGPVFPENRIFEPFFTTKEVGKGGPAWVWADRLRHRQTAPGLGRSQEPTRHGRDFQACSCGCSVAAPEPPGRTCQLEQSVRGGAKPSWWSRTKRPCGNWSAVSSRGMVTRFCRPSRPPGPSNSGRNAKTEIIWCSPIWSSRPHERARAGGKTMGTNNRGSK